MKSTYRLGVKSGSKYTTFNDNISAEFKNKGILSHLEDQPGIFAVPKHPSTTRAKDYSISALKKKRMKLGSTV